MKNILFARLDVENERYSFVKKNKTKKKYSRKQSLKVLKLIFNSVALKKKINLLNQRSKV